LRFCRKIAAFCILDFSSIEIVTELCCVVGVVFMGESSGRTALPSSSERGTHVPNCSPKFRNGFAIAARALWPRKTAAELAYRANVSERAAKFWLSGKREPSVDAVMVIVQEIRPRKRA